MKDEDSPVEFSKGKSAGSSQNNAVITTMMVERDKSLVFEILNIRVWRVSVHFTGAVSIPIQGNND